MKYFSKILIVLNILVILILSGSYFNNRIFYDLEDVLQVLKIKDFLELEDRKVKFFIEELFDKI